jgi:hypothetical protein
VHILTAQDQRKMILTFDGRGFSEKSLT